LTFADGNSKRVKPPARTLKWTDYSYRGKLHGFTAVANPPAVNGTKNKMEFVFTTAYFPRFRLRYFTNMNDEETNVFYKFRLGIVRIIEFNDSTTNGFIDPVQKKILFGLGI